MRFRFLQRLPVERGALFRFHEDPANLALLLRGLPSFRLLEHEGRITPGARDLVEERLGPLRMRFVFEHFVFEPPHRFGERQVEGPFKKFEHVHEFSVDGSGTLLVDLVTVELPWWLGGEVGVRVAVAPKIRYFFAHRKRAYAALIQDGLIPGAA